MRRLLFIAGALVLLLLTLALLGFQALKSGAGKAKLASALSSALGQPVVIGGMSVALLPRPALEATQVRIGSAERAAAPGVTLAGLHAVPSLLSFLPGRTRSLSRVDLVGLVVAVRRDTAGHWHIPVPPPGGAATSKSGGASEIEVRELRVRDGALRVVDDSLRTPAGGPTITTISSVAAELRDVGGRLEVPRFSGRLGQTVVTGSAEAGAQGISLRLSTESIRNADLPAFFALAGMVPYPGLAIEGKAPVDLTAHIAPDLATFVVTGKAAIERAQLGTMAFQDLRTPFRLEKGALTLDPIAFTLYGGHELGAVSIDLAKRPPVYTIRSTVDGLDVNQALSATTTMRDFLLGTARLSAAVRGSGATAPAIERSLAGTMTLAIKDGDIRNFPILAAINDALGITTGTMSDTRFQSLTATAAIGGGKARTDDLALRAGELNLLGQGTLGFDRSIDLHATAHLSAVKAGQLAQRVAASKHLQNSRGEIELPVTITGTATAPKITVDVQSIVKTQVAGELQRELKKLLPKP